MHPRVVTLLLLVREPIEAILRMRLARGTANDVGRPTILFACRLDRLLSRRPCLRVVDADVAAQDDADFGACRLCRYGGLRRCNGRETIRALPACGRDR